MNHFVAIAGGLIQFDSDSSNSLRVIGSGQPEFLLINHPRTNAANPPAFSRQYAFQTPVFTNDEKATGLGNVRKECHDTVVPIGDHDVLRLEIFDDPITMRELLPVAVKEYIAAIKELSLQIKPCNVLVWHWRAFDFLKDLQPLVGFRQHTTRKSKTPIPVQPWVWRLVLRIVENSVSSSPAESQPHFHMEPFWSRICPLSRLMPKLRME